MAKEAIFIFGGGLKNDSGRWRTTNFDEPGDNFGALGDRLRVVAASCLFQDFPNYLVIASGGKGQLKDIAEAPTVASVLKQELIDLGVTADKIIEEDKSANTFEELQELKKIIIDNSLDKIVVISNDYHLPRVQAFIDQDNQLRQWLAENRLSLQSAEEILMNNDPAQWQTMINKAYRSPVMKQRIKQEQAGVKAIKQGKYEPDRGLKPAVSGRVLYQRSRLRRR